MEGLIKEKNQPGPVEALSACHADRALRALIRFLQISRHTSNANKHILCFPYQAWWAVDLGEGVIVYQVFVYNIDDPCCGMLYHLWTCLEICSKQLIPTHEFFKLMYIFRKSSSTVDQCLGFSCL